MDKRFGIISVVSLMCFMCGCAGQSQSLQGRLDTLEAQNQSQKEQISSLQKQVGPQSDSFGDKVQAGWNWASSEASSAWHSDTAVEARARVNKCIDDLSTSSK